MNKTILVTGVGGGAGQSILKALQGSKYRVVGVDSEVLATGLYCCEKSYIGEYASSPKFIDRLLEICRIERVQVIFPGHDVELGPLSKNRQLFKENGISVAVSDLDVIEICDDKLATSNFLKQLGLPYPKTLNFTEYSNFEQPVVLKPRFGGARSKNTYLARTASEFEKFSRQIDPNNCVVQDFIEGDEYTIGSVTLGSKFIGSISMRRILRSGDTYKAFVEFNTDIDCIVKTICEKMNPFGALNIQLKYCDTVPYVFEINARCSGTTGARSLAGFNEPSMIADYIYDKTIPDFSIKKLSILRYWNEIVVSEEDIHCLAVKGYKSGNRIKL